MNLLTASNQWATRPEDQRFENLDSLEQAVAARRNKSRSTDISLSKVQAKEAGDDIIINSGVTPVRPTHWAFGQLARAISAPAQYLRDLPRNLATLCINDGIRKHGIQDLKFMTVEADGESEPNTLQAITSTTYGRIWDADVVASVKRIVERSGGKFHNPLAYDYNNGRNGVKPSGLYASDRDVFMFLIDGGSLLEAGPRAEINRGFFCWNSEVGSRTFGLTTFLFNRVCGNHIVWDASNVKTLTIRHNSGAPDRFDCEAMPVLLDYANASAKPIEEAINRAQNYLLPAKSESEIVDWLSKHGKFSRKEMLSAFSFAKAEEGDCRTLWDVVQGLTAYARGFDFVDARVDLETRAGNLLNLVK
jgi:hypothetical protein